MVYDWMLTLSDEVSSCFTSPSYRHMFDLNLFLMSVDEVHLASEMDTCQSRLSYQSVFHADHDGVRAEYAGDGDEDGEGVLSG